MLQTNTLSWHNEENNTFTTACFHYKTVMPLVKWPVSHLASLSLQFLEI